MKRRAFFPVLLAAVILIGSVSAARSQTETPTAASLLEEMAKAYAALQSYSDKSVAIYTKPDGAEQLTVDFRLWFSRPASFRVDAESKQPGAAGRRREVLWADGAVTRTWATDRAVASHAKVQLVGSGMFGTYAYHIPTLLEPSYGALRRLNELTSPELSGDEVLDGVDCQRVRGDWQGDAYEVWIGKEDHLVRKLVAKYADHQLEEVHREITINQPIPIEIFRFAPENEKLPKKP